ncbi:MAG TPA: tRNA 2-selenouridine(34) synthase MnmH [Burkholderiales bacterium]
MKQTGTVTLAQLSEFDEVIDVRSPSEFALDHVPEAVNCPVLDDAERAEVGTLHKQSSPFDAKKIGAALVSKNIARHIEDRFRDRAREWRPLVYCWRGGKRSGAMAHVLREVGWPAATLEGGYRAYRREVVRQLGELPGRLRFEVICGATGSGKSRLLEAIAARGAQVLDLEGIARHRGSVLGELPDDPQPSQKMFDSMVWDRLRRFDTDRPVYVEAESKKIGQLQVPELLLERMRASACVRLEAPVEARVRFLIEEYGHFLEEPARLKAKLACLRNLHGSEVVARWAAQIDAAQWDQLVTDLLVRHYDPAYQRSTLRNYVRSADPGALELAELSPRSFGEAADGLLANR